MTGTLRFLSKETVELLRTWRLPVVGGVVLFFAITGPVLALLTPEILRSMQASQPGVIIQVPDPTWRDAYAQWIKNLSQIVAFVTIISAAGSVAGEVASGTAQLVLTKPVSRSGFVVAKGVAFFGLVAGVVLIGAALTQAMTLAVYGVAPSAPLWGPTLVWLVFAALLIAVAVLLSTVAPTLAAAGIGVGVLFVLSLAGMWGPAVRFTPAGLTVAPSQLLAGQGVDLLWPLLTTVVAAVFLLALAAVLFTRREL